MITLRNKLYESLLDDEEDLVNNEQFLIEQWANLLNMKYEPGSELSYFGENKYTVNKGKIMASTINPGYMVGSNKNPRDIPKEIPIDKILPEYLDFENIHTLSLNASSTRCACPDILSNSGLKKISKFPVVNLRLSYGNTKLDSLDFNLVGNSRMKTMHIQIPFLGEEYFVDIKHWPKFKLDSLWINSRMRPIIFDNIKGLDCTNFVFEGARFSEDSFSKLTIDEPFKAVSTLDNTEKGIATLDRFFQNNKVDNLIYIRTFNMKNYRYRIDKKGRGKGYKLTRLK